MIHKENQRRVDVVIKKNWWIKQRNITLKLDISQERTLSIIKMLNCRKSLPDFLQQQLMDAMKKQLKNVFFNHYCQKWLISSWILPQEINSELSLWPWKQKAIYVKTSLRFSKSKDIQNSFFGIENHADFFFFLGNTQRRLFI